MARTSCSDGSHSSAKSSCSGSSNSIAKLSFDDNSSYGAAPCRIPPLRPLHGSSSWEFQLPQVLLANPSTSSGRLPSYLRRVPEDADDPVPQV